MCIAVTAHANPAVLLLFQTGNIDLTTSCLPQVSPREELLDSVYKNTVFHGCVNHYNNLRKRVRTQSYFNSIKTLKLYYFTTGLAGSELLAVPIAKTKRDEAAISVEQIARRAKT